MDPYQPQHLLSQVLQQQMQQQQLEQAFRRSLEQQIIQSIAQHNQVFGFQSPTAWFQQYQPNKYLIMQLLEQQRQLANRPVPIGREVEKIKEDAFKKIYDNNQDSLIKSCNQKSQNQSTHQVKIEMIEDPQVTSLKLKTNEDQQKIVSYEKFEKTPPLNDNESESSYVPYEAKEPVRMNISKPQLEITKKVKKIKNVKNIPKNIFKGLMKFITGRRDLIKKILQQHDVDEEKFLNYIKQNKSSVLSMQQLKNLLYDDSDEIYVKVLRIITQNNNIQQKFLQYIRFRFFSQQFVSYIYNSNIRTKREHLLHRRKFLKIILKNQFNEFQQQKLI